MNELTPQQIVKWFRDQAATFIAMADQVEHTFKPNGSFNPPDTGTIPFPQSRQGSVTLEQIQKRLRTRKARLRELALEFNVDEPTIKKLIEQPGSGIKAVGRGWLSVEEK